ncbi:MAG: esterase-like activity of phytase family protein [Phycisphaerales bacterium]|nr:esterase-like activity of phytase family protein [Phycisphaerales bacterium]
MAHRGVMTLIAFGALGACAAAPRADPAPPGASVRLEWIGHANLAFEDDRLGGLSGLTYGDGRWFAVTDHPREPRLVELAIELNGATKGIDARVAAWEPVPAHADAEAVEWIEGRTFAVGFELPGAVALFETGGATLDEFTLPAHVLRGMRPNRRFEALALRHHDGRHELWAGIETALEQDGPEAGPGAGAMCRVLALDVDRAAPTREFVYQTEPAPGFLPGTSFNSLVDFAALDDGRLLALERSLDPLRGYAVAIRLITPGAGETDVAGLETLRGAEFTALRVETIARFGSLNSLGPGNVEGLAIGPVIDDEAGGRLVILVSDDNFGREGPRGALVIALRLLTSADAAPAPSAPR